MTDSIKMTHPDSPAGCIYVPPAQIENMELKGWQVGDQPAGQVDETQNEDTQNG